MEKMALQQLLQKHKNAIVAVGFNAVAIPLMYKFNHKTLLSSQLINIGIQLGTQVYVAAISGPSMFANLDPDTFADIQAVLFPRYILFNSSTSLLALLGYMKMDPAASLTSLWSPGFNLVMSLATNLANLFVFFPWTHTTLVTYMTAKKNNDPKTNEARKMFGIVHGLCNLLNFGTMGANLLFMYGLTTLRLA